MNIRFDGKRALVTGAGKGIGRGVTIKLAELGAEVIAVSRTQSDLDELAKISNKIKTVCLDIGDWEATRAAFQDFGTIDLLVNNAGITGPYTYKTVTEAEVDKVFDINIKAAINITLMVVKDLKARGQGGSIVNVSSIGGSLGMRTCGIYSVSKGALSQFTRNMAVLHGPDNIRVNAVCPTIVNTYMARYYFNEENAHVIPFKERTPLKKFAEVEDVVDPILFLLSDKSSMITGVNLNIDGGVSLAMGD